MEIDKCFEELESKYGEDFCWFKIDPEKNGFVSEAYREITEGHPLQGMKLTCLAKCEANDDVLYITEHGQFVVIHLTYSNNNSVGYPKYKLLDTHQELKEYLEQNIEDMKKSPSVITKWRRFFVCSTSLYFVGKMI